MNSSPLSQGGGEKVSSLATGESEEDNVAAARATRVPATGHLTLRREVTSEVSPVTQECTFFEKVIGHMTKIVVKTAILND